MTWIATAGETQVTRDNQYSTEITFSNDTLTFVERFVHDGTPRILRALAQRWVNGFDARASCVASIPSGRTVDLTPDPPSPGPTAAEIAQSDFVSNWRLFQGGLRGLQAGLPVSTSQLSQLQASLISSYRTTYVRYL